MHPSTGTGRVVAGRYRLTEPIGRGAMGTVWRGRDELLDRDVAVKELRVPDELLGEERSVAFARTMREARTAARLSHPGVVTVYDVAEEDGQPWIVMELIDGRSLDRVIAHEGPLPPHRAAEAGRQLLAALAAAHSVGVLHRDVKPSNVLLAEGRAVLTDFGIATFQGDARLTQTGLVMGSPGFTAPERIRGEPATPASDLWSLGATLYAAVEGRGPFDRRGGAITTMSAVLNEEPPPAPSAGALTAVITALLNRDPTRRPDAATAAAMLETALAAARSRRFASRTDPPAVLVPRRTRFAGYGRPFNPPDRSPSHREPPRALPSTAPAAIPPPRDDALPVMWTDQPAPSPTTRGGDATFGDAPLSARPSGAVTGRLSGGDATVSAAAATTGQPGGRRGIRFGVLAVAAAAVAALIAGVVVAVLPTGTGRHREVSTPRRARPAGADPALAAVAGPPVTGPLPAGFHWYTLSATAAHAAAGFTIAVPNGWSVINQGPSGRAGAVTYLQGPRSAEYLQVDLTPHTYQNMLAEARYLERETRAQGKFPGYRRIGITAVRIRGSAAAAWRFTWLDPAAGRVRVLDLMYIAHTSAGAQSYALYLSAPLRYWRTALTSFDEALRTFRPLPR